MKNELFLERMRSPEIGTAIESAVTTILVSCVPVEQHGPHLPLLVDVEHGTCLGAKVAKRLGNTFVAPTIRVGCSEHHMSSGDDLSSERHVPPRLP
jgi:creatinine amidohydrolase|tara:strand:+ start:28134 stop:28421 length:288 start_codon:yes stop_codon:yes gene_type:complete